MQERYFARFSTIKIISLLATLSAIFLVADYFYVKNFKKAREIVRELFSISANQAALSAKVDAINARLDLLGKAPPPFDVRAELEAALASAIPKTSQNPAAQPYVRWNFIGGSDLYQQSGLLEFYGATVSQRRTGPVATSGLILTSTAPKSWLVWSPTATPRFAPRYLILDVDPDSTFAGKLAVTLALKDGRSFRFVAELGPPILTNKTGIAVTPPDDVREAYEKAEAPVTFGQASSTRFIALIPQRIAAALSAKESSRTGVKSWIVTTEHPVAAAFVIRALALSTALEAPPSATSDIVGTVADPTAPLGEPVELEFENGSRTTTTIGHDGSFNFPNVPIAQPISLRYRRLGKEYHAALGRWFMPVPGRLETVIRVAPEFSNPQGLPPNSADIAMASDVTPEMVRLTPTRRTSWPGHPPKPQEFEGKSFVNNGGFLDRDRDVFNRDRCFRIFAVGGSTYVALQVKPGEKFNILLEAELGRRLGRCVEVISAGRDNGDLGANYRTIRDYGMKFEPEIVVIELMSALVMQMGPDLLRRTIGWNYEHSALDNFYFDSNGKLTFRPWDPSYPLDAVKPDSAPLIPGLDLWKSLHIPYDRFASQTKEAFQLYAAIIERLKVEFPNTRFVLATGRDQAGCRNESCNGQFTLSDGPTVSMGVSTLLDNFSKLCHDSGVTCIHPPLPRPDEAAGLLYQNDGHYSVQGHQWLARHLTDGLLPLARSIISAPVK